MARSLSAVRPVSTEERAVLWRAIRYAPTGSDEAPSLDQIDSLQVVSKCQCGCASVEFQHLKPGEIAELVADGIGETSSGEHVGVLVFALGGKFTGLEIVGHTDDPAPLPVASTVRGWDGQGSLGAA